MEGEVDGIGEGENLAVARACWKKPRAEDGRSFNYKFGLRRKMGDATVP